MPTHDDLLDSSDAPEDVRDGIALALSGGGYRAMLFHAGALVRINEARILPKLKRVSSVSGGSLAAGRLGLVWKKLDFQKGSANQGIAANFDEQFVRPIRAMASETVDSWSIVLGPLVPGMTISDFVARSYRKKLFGDATLQDLPNDDEGPRFVINATSVQTGALVRFSKPYAADYLVGRILNPKISLAEAVAASSAFPPVLSPVSLDVAPSSFEADPTCPLQKRPFNDTWVLTDGGVYDNLGLETVVKNYRTILVSDGGGKIAPEGSPPSNWAEHSLRVMDIVDNQVRSLRKRILLDRYKAGTRKGAFWGIRTNIGNYRLDDPMTVPHEASLRVAEMPTRLKALGTDDQNRLMNWGYAVCDAALRKHAADELPVGFTKPTAFPYPGGI